MQKKRSVGVILSGIAEIISGLGILWTAVKFNSMSCYVIGILYIILGSLLFTQKNIFRIINLFICIIFFSLSIIRFILSIISLFTGIVYAGVMFWLAFVFAFLNAIFITDLTRPKVKEQFR